MNTFTLHGYIDLITITLNLKYKSGGNRDKKQKEFKYQ